MSLRKAPRYQQADIPANTLPDNESDAEEEALAADYREQVQFDDGGVLANDNLNGYHGQQDLLQASSLGGANASLVAGPDIQAQLAAAATPLEYQASLETKFASYDNYCSLFHFILNSDGPVDLEVPSVSSRPDALARKLLDG